MTETTTRREYPSAEINWEARCGKLITDGITAGNQHKLRMHEKNVELQQARQRIAELEKQVKELTPNAELTARRLAQAERERDHARNERNARGQEVRDLRRRIAQGQRGVIQDVIGYLTSELTRLPKSEGAPVDAESQA